MPPDSYSCQTSNKSRGCCRSQLAPVKLIRRQYWKIEFNAKPIARAHTQPAPLWRQHATTKNDVDFDFDLTGFTFDDQLGIAKISGRNQSRMQPELREIGRASCRDRV